MDKNTTKNINSIFESDDWLECVAPQKWDRIIVSNKNGDIDASFPVYKSKSLGFKTLGVPPLTQTLGIYLKDTGAKLTKKLEREKKLITQKKH